MILYESHNSRLSLCPSVTKMYQDLNKSFWWYGVKVDVYHYVSSCFTYQKTKVKHEKSGDMLQ